MSALPRSGPVRGTAALNESTVISGIRTRLKMPVANDYTDWSKLRAESRHFLKPWEPTWPRDDLTRMAFRRRLRRYHREIRADEGYAVFVYEADSGALAGGITLAHVKRGVTQSCSLGYWMGERFAGQGLMGDAVRAIVPFCFETLGLNRIEAATLPHNERSIRLLKRVGFTEEGYARRFLCINGAWRDHILFGLVNGDTIDPTRDTPS
ncbi:GNAT family N-acetyltransferase [Acuticoccus sp. I52.16.1]|uniref:GNAT family N-acetyltransferase n=1 Tax=Acuticoccus sp. I52.16.1 TaxID=2928472 RepID=UPI001FD1A626|nr:GNAT family protein [Acuticoccus sp. I52.16.1]UOM33373.1 GNAT family N-acetyltransferase [Acuticoccus sp. I52.16.1]